MTDKGLRAFSFFTRSLLATAVLGLTVANVAQADDGEATSESQMKPYTEKCAAEKLEIEMVPIKGGEFAFGSPANEAGRKEDESTPVKIAVDPFWMGKYEITWDEYNAFREEYAHAVENELNVKKKLPPEKQLDAVSIPTPLWEQDSRPILNGMGTDGMPVGDISQFAAKQFTKWLSKKTGRFYRLPTEAEWEYAARAGTTTPYSFGDDPTKLGDYAIYIDNSLYDDPEKGHPDFGAGWRKVGSKKPNPWGLYDMHGNVAEWVIDGWDADHFKKLAAIKQPVHWKDAICWPTEMFPRVARGGHWDADPAACRSASRLKSDPLWQDRDPQLPKSVWWYTDSFHVGFRVVRPLKTPSKEEQHKFWESDNEYEQNVIMKNDKIIKIIVEKCKKEAE